MRKIEVVYSPLCEATGAMIEKLKQWLDGTDIEIKLFSFDNCPERLKEKYCQNENCFIDVFYNGNKIDTVPLHQDIIARYFKLTLPFDWDTKEERSQNLILSKPLMQAYLEGEIVFYPISFQNYKDEMMMCLWNYPFGNPPKKFHQNCIEIKKQVFNEAWKEEEIAGVYAKYKENVIGLLEVFPREILKKYGYMTGTTGKDKDFLSVGCYEVGYGISRVDMIDLLMRELQAYFPLFHRQYIEGVGIYGWNEGFNPYWVYEKYHFKQSEKLADNVIVMSKKIK